MASTSSPSEHGCSVPAGHDDLLDAGSRGSFGASALDLDRTRSRLDRDRRAAGALLSARDARSSELVAHDSDEDNPGVCLWAEEAVDEDECRVLPAPGLVSFRPSSPERQEKLPLATDPLSVPPRGRLTFTLFLLGADWVALIAPANIP
eukprot:Hpha_TRINITY_DN16556_c2_g2::TRINITY_DN16556_c2_g2_i1::g.135745::m.135745